MSFSITYVGAPDGDDGPFDLCSANDWKAFGAWVSTLPGEYASLKALANDGSADSTSQLAEELRDAVSRFNPGNGPALYTATEILSTLGPGDPDEMAVVTDE